MSEFVPVVPQAVEHREGVPAYTKAEFAEKKSRYCLLIPVINEGERILAELDRATAAGVTTGPGKQGAQLRMGIAWALERGYEGVLTIDGNNKDSIESVPLFLAKLKEGYDLIQGSRFIKGGRAVNTPPSRYAAVRLIHAPVISLAAGQWFTDTTNAYRAYSRAYLTHPAVQPLREVFVGYELLAYLSIRATQLGLKACEVPVTRAYPKTGATPTKIKGMRGNADLLKILFRALAGRYNPN